MNNLVFPILRLLADGRFHSGEDIARQFSVTRASVWNAMQAAEALGVEVFSVRGRGYRLPEPVQLLDYEPVLTALGERRKQFRLELHDEIDSTNTYLMQQAANGAPHASCIAALLQTKGRGRRGRSWQAALGASLTFSLLWRFQAGAAALSGLSLGVGIALIRTLRALGIDNVQLKWPNDILVGRDKLAGILIELQGDMDGPSAAVIGIGLNLKLPAAVRAQIDQPVTDLARLSKQNINPNELLGALLNQLACVLEQFESQGFESLRNEWEQYHAYHQQAVRLLFPDGRELHGTVNGVAQDGVLLVNTDHGVQRFSSGEISLRGAA
ncbi:bifunctional biotin--[acetyl-CoA-carboxylase] ligase/biotin operon repressor BirA [Methylobacillus gramineus]|uniref:bifunctional biotin--[acetyl-CoA-carboxylase] ligase/biotin operon repressor BirA n=1 Tax=Methylobacillus gramineus TaxID=755169 RepID=UPI001CFF8A58|nr:bifunctional biotin--[acetyl-CoA-carboxylase] ligase/biotin operon repressor BirA [Methylobacillus gramineus]MCB5183595.1 bifunctional biotin--[acetyl-CoA-carboxylase] ligase/biotin operon repressor BirA [Methylobacillus gramineus]